MLPSGLITVAAGSFFLLGQRGGLDALEVDDNPAPVGGLGGSVLRLFIAGRIQDSLSAYLIIHAGNFSVSYAAYSPPSSRIEILIWPDKSP